MSSTYASSIIQHPIIADPIIDPEEWEAFWHTAINGTLFNSLNFLSYHPGDRFMSYHLTFRRKGNLVGIFAGVIVEEDDGTKSWVSHPGASYGGPAWSPKLRYHHLEALVEALVNHARDIGVNRIIMTPPPVVYNENPEQQLQFALSRLGFNIIRTELTQAVQLDAPETNLLGTFANKTRNAYRRAQKLGLEFKIIEQPNANDLDRFWEILVENRAGLGVVPAHNRQEIELLHQLVPENLMLGAIEYEGKVIASIWNFICNEHTLLEFYMAHQEPYQQLKPVPLLTYHSMLWAHSQGFKYFDFGISSIWSEPTWGLLKFKENFNAKHYLRLTYKKELT